MIIDCHTHGFPAEAVRAPREWAAARGEDHWSALVAPLGRPSIQGWSDPETMLADMDAAGVDRAILLGWYWQHEATCREQNRFLANWTATAPDRLLAFASIQPAVGADAVLEQLDEAAALGFCGIGECLPQVQGYGFDDDGFCAMADWAVRQGWPINFHVTEVAGRNYPGRIETPLMPLVELARTRPAWTLILSHWGGGLPFLEHNPAVRKAFGNVLYDCAASPLLYDPAVFRTAVDCVGPDRVLFGSDYPLRLYPREQRRPEMQRFINSIRTESGLDEFELNRLFTANARQLLGIQSAGSGAA